MGMFAAEALIDLGIVRFWRVVGLLVTFVPATWYFAWWVCDGAGSQVHRRFVWRNLWLLALSTGVAGLWIKDGANPYVVGAVYATAAALLLGSVYVVLNRELRGEVDDEPEVRAGVGPDGARA